MQKHRIEKARVAAEKAEAKMFRALEISRNAKKENVPFDPAEFCFAIHHSPFAFHGLNPTFTQTPSLYTSS